MPTTLNPRRRLIEIAPDEPRAWLGYASIWPRVSVRICQDCADRGAAEAIARRAGFVVRLTRCPACAARQGERQVAR